MRNIFKNTKPTGKLMINHESWGVYVFQTNPYTGNPGFQINYVSFLQSCAQNQFSDWKIWKENMFATINKKGISETYGDTNQSWHYPSGNCYLNYLIIHLELYCFSHLLPWHEPPGVFLGFLWSWHIRGDSVCQTESWTISNKETSNNCEWKQDTQTLQF